MVHWNGCHQCNRGCMDIFVIGKLVTPRFFKHIKHLPFRYSHAKKTIMTDVLFEEWVRRRDCVFRNQEKNNPFHRQLSLSSKCWKSNQREAYFPNTFPITWLLSSGWCTREILEGWRCITIEGLTGCVSKHRAKICHNQ